MMKKLRSNCGETLVETLVSIVIVSLVFLFLTTSAVTATRINRSVHDEDVSFSYSDEADESGATVKVSASGIDISISVDQYTTENGYAYYTYPTTP